MEQTYFPTLFHVTALLLIQYCCMQTCLAINNAATNITTDQSALLALKARIDSDDPNNVLANNWSTNAPVCNWIGISCDSRHQRVTVLNLSHMKLKGTIPSHLGNLSFLVKLIMRDNSFHGYLPPELARLRCLRVLNFGSNELNGEIPSWIGLLTRLRSLFLNANSFTGSMPSMISNLSSLEILALQANKLSGRLTMDKFDNLPNLQAIGVDNNQFHGELPSTLYNCKQLKVLSLSVNNFSGRLLPQIGNITTLRLLFLGYNKLEEYGSEGIISTRGDAYSYGILLMEIFTRKKPTDDMFSGEISLKSWVEESLSLSINEVVDTNLLRNERDYAAIEGCLSSVMRLALNCCEDSPRERMDMKTVSITLNKIKSKFLQDTE